ncbi:hypothetical protein M408DRAFT_197479 [Serendipita vermifera MAFF 305830]|uniref:Uncharacterized protein n=1 Tax=Serendipita vermifera MAFF 305830 TaxID=933852 RepID=A0A0C3B212_SERVB|nr:hypothetical protein M408DRAFT_197479 [Serendipita vermifera MAFF 305830]
MATVAIIAVIALICFLCYRHRRKVKQQQQQAEEHKDAVAFIPAAALSRGSGPGPGPYVFQPFNPYNLSPSSADTNAPPVAIASTHPWEPHGPSSHFPPEDDQVRSDSSPSTPPASSNRTSVQTRSSSIHTPPLVMSYPPRRALSTSTTASTRTDRESTHTRVESLNHQTRVHYAGENDTKAYHGRATMASFSSSPSRPLSPSTISESLLPPPQYEC